MRNALQIRKSFDKEMKSAKEALRDANERITDYIQQVRRWQGTFRGSAYAEALQEQYNRKEELEKWIKDLEYVDSQIVRSDEIDGPERE